MWKAVEASSEKIRIGKAEGKRRKRRSREEAGRKGKEKRTKERKDSRSQESSREVGDLGQRRESSKIGSGSQKVGAGKILQMDKSIWEETI